MANGNLAFQYTGAGEVDAPALFYASGGTEAVPYPAFLFRDRACPTPVCDPDETPLIPQADDPELFALAVQYWLMRWGVQEWAALEPFDPDRRWDDELALIEQYLYGGPNPPRPLVSP